MKIAVIGANGQLGWELVRSLAPLGQVTALTRADLDLSRPDDIPAVLRNVAADVIVNAAAYTAVDLAETNETIALRINGEALAVLASESAHAGSLLIHYSTDYVFDGEKPAPYVETDPVAPLNVYGRSKVFGERALERSGADWLIFRTTWVYAARGNNFMRTMMRLATERDVLRVVADQHGAPTSARFLADATAHVVRQAQQERLANRFEAGLYHLSASGSTSWHGFANAIVQSMRDDATRHDVRTTRVEAIATKDYPTPARRPRNSLLDHGKFIERFDFRPPDWHDEMKQVMQQASQA